MRIKEIYVQENIQRSICTSDTGGRRGLLEQSTEGKD